MSKTAKKNSSYESTMSLGDHLEELRLRLILALFGLLVGTIICLAFGTKLVRFIQKPYVYAVKRTTNDPNCVSLESLPDEYHLTTLAPADAFISYMKISLISGLIISAPWVIYQIWMFVASGLYAHEKRCVRISVPFVTILFISGALFFLFVVAPISLQFFLTFGDLINVSNNWTLQKYVYFITTLMLVFGIGFQTPIAIFILNKTGLVSISSIKKSRKYVLLSIFIIAAVATPPDVISQITLAIPLYFLFELGIILSYFSGRRKTSSLKE